MRLLYTLGSVSPGLKGLKVVFFVGGVAAYRSAEGKTVEVSYKGDVENTVIDVLGGLRSACTYTGAAKLKELPRRATFIRCTQQLNNMYS